ncbi:hypothetical protein F4778DRAFT_786239 [Xylariomycetidae sp. FL2044]|nr:hypothetical protein F4778DRAFT_786239 [Xylariomycetidae sp. FL2044]
MARFSFFQVFLTFMVCASAHVPSRPPPSSGRVEAITPTSSGQIGINPVTLPEPTAITASIGVDTQYLTDDITNGQTTTKWIGVDPWFETSATTMAANGQPTPTAVSKGFIVSADAAGGIDITISEAMHDKIASILVGLPDCGLPKRRRGQQAAKRQTDVTCELRQRLPKIIEQLSQDEDMVTQLTELNADVAWASGHDAQRLAESGQMMAFETEEEVAATLGLEIEINISIEVSVWGVLVGVAKAITVLGDAWKMKAAAPQPVNKLTPTVAPRPTPTPTPTTAGPTCPMATSLLCDGCGGGDGGGAGAKCTQGDFKDCACVEAPRERAEIIHADFDLEEDLILPFVYTPPDPNNIPSPDCSVNSPLDVEKSLFQNLINVWCSHTNLTKENSITLTASAAGVTKGYQDWQFVFDFGGYCNNSCNSVYDRFVDSCSHTSHTRESNGTIDMYCGQASYGIVAPAPVVLGQPACSDLQDPHAAGRVQRDDAARAVDLYCDMKWRQMHFQPTMSWGGFRDYHEFALYEPFGDEPAPLEGRTLHLEATWFERGCPPVRHNFDFDKCRENFMTAIDKCAPFTNPPDRELFLKYPAWNANDCFKWSISIV